MKQIFLITACVSGSALAALVVESQARAEATEVPLAGPGEAAAVAQLRHEVSELRAALADRMEIPVAAHSQRAPASSAGMDEKRVEEVVRNLVSEDAIAATGDAPVVWPGGAATAAAGFQRILEAGVISAEASELWAEAAAQGQLHELLAAMEERLADEPESAGKHYDRARAYYAAARALPSNSDGNWWVDSNNAYNQVLELDPEHWDARYEKARNMAFWPVAYGGQAEAIRHFEILTRQQEARSSEPRFAQTYVWLGNLYDQQGRTEDARAAWTRGLSFYPDNGWLKEKLATLGY